MVALTKSRVRLISVPGTEWVDRGYALEDLEAGDLVVVDATVEPTGEYDMRVELATGTDACGLVLKDVKAGGLAEFAKQGEVDGFVGLTPNALYTIVGGEIDSTAPAAGTPKQFRARNATSIWFSLI
jgi:hypothetical protein